MDRLERGCPQEELVRAGVEQQFPSTLLFGYTRGVSITNKWAGTFSDRLVVGEYYKQKAPVSFSTNEGLSTPEDTIKWSRLP